MKILLINAMNTEKEINMPLGLLSIGTILKNEGHEVEIIDFNNLKDIGEILADFEDKYIKLADYAINKEPDMIDFYSLCHSYHNALMIAKYIKQTNPNIKIVFGGPQASLTAEASMKAFAWIDMIGIGEGEATILNMVKALNGQVDYREVSGIAYRDGENNVIINKEDTLIDDLDMLPMYDYSIAPSIETLETASVDSGRGCPYGCHYCSTKTFWKRKFRLKSAERILKEIKDLYYNHNKKVFKFVHDLFTVDKQKVIAVCELIINEKLSIAWNCSARPDTLDEDTISCLSRAGCKNIFLGVETGSSRMQKLSNKNLDLDKLWDVLALLNQYDISPILSFIYGYPEETEDDLRQTLDTIIRANQMGVEEIGLHLCTILPGTEYFYKYKKNLVLDDICSTTINANPTIFKDYIDKYPEIFPQMYNLKTPLRSDFKDLESFVVYYHAAYIKFLKSTYKLILDYYNYDLIKLYKDFIKLLPQFAPDLLRYKRQSNVSDITSIGYTLDKMSEFINQGAWGNRKIVIEELFKYERDIYRFLYLSDIERMTQTYFIDIIDVRYKNMDYTVKNVIIDDTIFNPISIIFRRTPEKGLEMQEV